MAQTSAMQWLLGGQQLQMHSRMLASIKITSQLFAKITIRHRCLVGYGMSIYENPILRWNKQRITQATDNWPSHPPPDRLPKDYDGPEPPYLTHVALVYLPKKYYILFSIIY